MSDLGEKTVFSRALNFDDEDMNSEIEITLQTNRSEGLVWIDFRAPVNYLAMNRKAAEQFAELILKKAREL